MPFTYPFLTDFLSALFVTASADLRTAIVLPAILGAGALVLLLHRWTLDLTNDALAAAVAPILMLVGGGLGWWVFLQEAWQAPGNVGPLLTRLPHDYTIRKTGLRFGNVITTLLITQRGINLAFPLAVVVFRQWWLAAHDAAGRPNESVRRMLAAGVVAGLLPLIHGHVHGRRRMAGCLALLFRMWPAWIAFVVVAAGLSLPQLLWLAKGSAVDSASFVGWQFGWDRGETGAVVFWLMNTGALIPIIVWRCWRVVKAAVFPRDCADSICRFCCVSWCPTWFAWRRGSGTTSRSSCTGSRLHTARVPRSRTLVSQWELASGLAIALFISLTAAGTLDLWRLLSRAAEIRVLSQPAIEFARLVASTTESNATVLHAPIHNHSVALSGRRSLMGFPGHIWSQGIDAGAREREIRTIYEGGPVATGLLAQHRVHYVVIGMDERRFTKVNEAFFSPYPVVAKLGTYRLHRVVPPQ